jgi:tetratricopeptide (TPR) repeat protein
LPAFKFRLSLLALTGLIAVTFGSVAPAPVAAEQGLGPYLAGRQAILNGDYVEASEYFRQALPFDPDNPGLQEDLVLAELAQGHVDVAYPVAAAMEAAGLRSQVAHMVAVAYMTAHGEFKELLDRPSETHGIGPLVDGLVAGWATVGAGRTSEGMAQFDAVAVQDGLRSFALYQKVLALALSGEFDAAESIFAAPEGGLTVLTRRAAMARAEILSQLDRNDDALDLLHDAFGTDLDPSLDHMAQRLQAGEKLAFTHARTPQEGMAEVFFTLAQALNGEASDDYALIYSRLAEYLRPDHIDARLLTAELLERMGQHELAVQAYANVPRDHPDFHAAEQGRAGALRSAGRIDAAIEVLTSLSRDYPDLSAIHSALGDLLRQQEQFAKAAQAYGHALDASGEQSRGRWFLHYARGICYERLGEWPLAESDFRIALDLNPGQPQVLNYLGYSLVEKQIKLTEALAMIEQAVAAQPDSGYIVDSLGWVLFRLGRYDEAVDHMENAVALMPVDPVVNDHLGDVYWAVGRTREAEFQWRRALSFIDPADTDGEADPERIRHKIEIGLDALLKEDGAEPLANRDDSQ